MSVGGPTVPISLFPDAAQAGIRAGNSLPTTTTSIIQGALQGVGQSLDFIQQGQQIEAADQVSQIRENQIQQLPTQNQMQQERLESAQISNEIRTLQIEKAKALQVEELAATKGKLQEDLSRLKQAEDLREKEDTFTKTFSQSTPQKQAQMVLGGQYSDLFSAKPELFKQAAVAVRPSLNDQQKEAVDSYMRKSSAMDYWDKEALKRRQTFEVVKAGVMNDPVTQAASAALSGYTPEEFPEVIKFYPSGRFETENGKVKFNIKTGQPVIRSPDRELKGMYDAIYVDPKNPRNMQVISSSVPGGKGSSKEIYDAYIAEKSLQNGTVSKTAADNAERQAQEQKAAKKQQAQLSPDSATRLAPSGEERIEDPFTGSIQQLTGLPIQDVEELKVPINALKTQLFEYMRNPALRNDLGTAKAITNAKDTIIRYTSDKEFDESPAIQASYTQAKVDAYNRAIDAEFGISPSRAFGSVATSVFGLSGTAAYASLRNKVLDSQKVTGPKGLYYVNRKISLDAQFKPLLAKFASDEAKKATQPFREHRSKQNSIQYLEAVKSGVTLEPEK
jgi:hypothetical protein